MYKIIIVMLSFLLPFFVSGQSSSSPYSGEGVGDLARTSFSRSHAMGGISAGVRSHQHINYHNPASYTSQDTNSFILDFGLSGHYTKMATAGASAYTDDFSLNSIAVGFPLTRWWKSSVGVLPFSSVGYRASEIRSLEMEGGTSVDVNTYYQGYGGLNRLYWGNAFQITPHLSLGINSSYFFGFIQHLDSLIPVDPSIFSTIVNRQVSVSDFSFQFGAQYANAFSDDWHYTLGVTYQHRHQLSARESYSGIVEGLVAGNRYRDTLNYYRDQRSSVELPSSLSAGFTLGLRDQLLLGFDYAAQYWAQVSPNANYANSQFISLGLEYVPNPTAYSGYFNRVRYRAGGRTGTSYLMLNGNEMHDKSFTLGLGFPFRFTQNTINFAYEMGVRGSTENNIIQENYQFFWVNLTFQDVWFIKPKFR